MNFELRNRTEEGFMAEMTKRERLLAAVKGEPVDRVPASYYFHFHEAEKSADLNAKHMLEQQRIFDWDFVKVQLSAYYYGQAWGCTVKEDPVLGPQIDQYVIHKAEDYRKLKKVDVTQGPFGEQLRIAQMLNDALKGNTPFIQTTFSPLSVAGRIAGARNRNPNEAEYVKRFMKEDPDALHCGLKIISETLADYAREAVRRGAEGIFLTTTVYSKDVFTEEEYETFGKPYDLAVFNAANEEGAALNILHLCRENIMLDLASDYPVQIINYEATSPRNPSLKEALERTDKAVWGGLDHLEVLPKGPVEAIRKQVRDALEQTGGRRFILGPGCTGLVRVPDAHLMAAREALL